MDAAELKNRPAFQGAAKVEAGIEALRNIDFQEFAAAKRVAGQMVAFFNALLPIPKFYRSRAPIPECQCNFTTIIRAMYAPDY